MYKLASASDHYQAVNLIAVQWSPQMEMKLLLMGANDSLTIMSFEKKINRPFSRQWVDRNLNRYSRVSSR